MTCRPDMVQADRSIHSRVGAGYPDSLRPAQSAIHGDVGGDIDALAAALAQRLGVLGVPTSPALDSRTLGEAWREIDSVLLGRSGVLSASTCRNTRIAWRHVLSAPIDALVAAPRYVASSKGLGHDVCADDLAVCGKRKRCTADDPEALGGPIVSLLPVVTVRVGLGRRRLHRRPGMLRRRREVLVAGSRTRPTAAVIVLGEGITSITIDHVVRLGDVRICDLGPKHVTAAWNALAGPSLSTYAAHFVARLKEADSLGFVGLRRWRDQWPSVPQSARRHIEVSDQIHHEVLLALEWALDHTETELQTVRLLAFAVHTPGRLDEVCSLRLPDVDLRGGVLRLRDSKTGPGQVVITSRGADLLRAQIDSLPWDAAWVWPSDSAVGHVLRDSVSHAWLRIRRAYAEATRRPEARALLQWRAHDFRGALATQALEHGASIRHVQKALRHSDVRTTERYDHGGSMTGARAAMELAVKSLKKRGES